MNIFAWILQKLGEVVCAIIVFIILIAKTIEDFFKNFSKFD